MLSLPSLLVSALCRESLAVVLGNTSSTESLPALSRALEDQDPVLREHAAWAIGRIDPHCRGLQDRLGREDQAPVRAAIHTALESR